MIKYLLYKYLRPSESFGFISLTKLLAFLGIALGVCVLLVSMAVMNGMNKSFTDKLLTMNYPITLYPTSNHADVNLLQGYQSSEFLQAQVAIKNGTQLDGAVIFGVDFVKEIAINKVLKDAISKQAVAKGLSTLEFARQLNSGFNIVLGSRLLEKISLQKGDKAALIFSELSPAGLSMAPIFKRFNVATSFKSGLAAYDSSYIYTGIDALKRVLKNQSFTGVHIFTEHPKQTARSLKTELRSEFIVVGWWEQNGNIISALELEKRSLFLILMMLVLIAALNIITSLLMIVLNRRKEIALLLALGASASEIKAAFFATGFCIGALGTLAGCVLAALCMWLLSEFSIISLPEDVYGSSTLPLDLSSTDACIIVIGALLISAFAAFYPAHKASKIDVLKTLRED